MSRVCRGNFCRVRRLIRHAALDTSRATQPWIQSNQRQEQPAIRRNSETGEGPTCLTAAAKARTRQSPPRLPKPHRPRTNQDWWPNQLDLQVLHQHSPRSNPMGEDFNYAEEFKTLDVDALKRDIFEVMTTSQDWWPADYGHYGPLFIRMSWHAAGTYRIADGRGGGGTARSASPRSTVGPTTRASTRRAGCSGRSSRSTAGKISWADLLVFAGNCAYESMGFKTFGFGFGRRGHLGARGDLLGARGHLARR